MDHHGDLDGFSIRRDRNILKIGSRVIAAPMAGVLEPPYRKLLHDRGLSLSFTEMISSRGTYERSKRTGELAGWVPEHGISGAQIFGNDPQYLTYAARKMVEMGHKLIDLNTGCPKRKVLVQGSGGAMLKDTDNLILCLEEIMGSVDVPVGIKMRSGFHGHDQDSFSDILMRIEGTGVSYIAIHPRTVKQGFKGEPDKGVIELASRTVNIPVIASGDVRTKRDIENYLDLGASAVMVGRGLMGDPFLIDRLERGIEKESFPDSSDDVSALLEFAREHLDENVEYFGEKRGCIKFRPHLGWYVQRYRDKNLFRDQIYHVNTKADVITLIDKIERKWTSVT
jgi:tRNA-dihydrouridine synthase B